MKILTIVGARPQFIKACAISRAIREKFSDRVEEIIVHTGQHYDPGMSEVFFTELKVPREKYNLNVGSGSHAQQTGTMMVEIEKLILEEKPDLLLLYGDTNSTLAGGLVAAKLHLPMVHVEAGVRAYKKNMPEEVNRIICDHMSAMLFVPTPAGMESLKKEGFNLEIDYSVPCDFDNPRVLLCGDIMYDNTLYFLDKLDDLGIDPITKYDLPSENLILATMHRPANVDQFETLERVLKSLIAVGEEHDKTVVIPLHPRTKNKVESNATLKELSNHSCIRVIEPISFLEMTALEQLSDLVITDSGGVQKEGYFVEKPVLIMLEETPWPELVESGCARVVDNDFDKIVEGARHFLNPDLKLEFKPIYGDGKASEMIMEEIIKAFG